MNEQQQQKADEGRAFALGLMARVGEVVRGNAAMLQQQAALIEQMKAQQTALFEQTAIIRQLAERVEGLTGQVEVLSRAALSDDEYAHAHAQAGVNGAGRQFASQVVSGLFGAFRPGGVPPHIAAQQAAGAYRPYPQQSGPYGPPPWAQR